MVMTGGTKSIATKRGTARGSYRSRFRVGPRQRDAVGPRWRYRLALGHLAELLGDRTNADGAAASPVWIGQKLTGITIDCPRCSEAKASLWRQNARNRETLVFKCRNCKDVNWIDPEAAASSLESASSAQEARGLLSSDDPGE